MRIAFSGVGAKAASAAADDFIDLFSHALLIDQYWTDTIGDILGPQQHMELRGLICVGLHVDLLVRCIGPLAYLRISYREHSKLPAAAAAILYLLAASYSHPLDIFTVSVYIIVPFYTILGIPDWRGFPPFLYSIIKLTQSRRLSR